MLDQQEMEQIQQLVRAQLKYPTDVVTQSTLKDIIKRNVFSSNVFTYASTVTLDVRQVLLNKTTTINAVGNATINLSGGGVAGQMIVVMIINDATSGKTVTFGTFFKPSATVGGTASKVAVVTFISDGNNFYETSRTTGLTI